jgi:hypothetical protein
MNMACKKNAALERFGVVYGRFIYLSRTSRNQTGLGGKGKIALSPSPSPTSGRGERRRNFAHVL